MAVMGAINVIFSAISSNWEKGIATAGSSLKNFDKVVDAVKGEGAAKSIKSIGEIINKIGNGMAAADKAFIEGKSGVEQFYESMKGLPIIGEFAQGIEKIGRAMSGLDRDIAKMEFASAFGEKVGQARTDLQKVAATAEQSHRDLLANLAGKNFVNAFFGDDRDRAQAAVDTATQIRDVEKRFKDSQTAMKEQSKEAFDELAALRKGKNNIEDRNGVDAQIASTKARYTAEASILDKQKAQEIAAIGQAAAIDQQAKMRQKVVDLMEQEKQKQVDIAKHINESFADLGKQLDKANPANDNRPGWVGKLDDFLQSNPGLSMLDYLAAQGAMIQMDAWEREKVKADAFRDSMQGLTRDLAEARNPGEGGRLFDLDKMGLGDGEVQRIKDLMYQVDQLNKLNQTKADLESKAKSIQDDALSAMERYAARVAEVNDLKDRGLITEKASTAGKLKAGKEFADSTGAGIAKLPTLLDRQFTFSLPTSETMGKDPAAELKRIAADDLKESKDQTRVLKELRDKAAKDGLLIFNIGVA